MYWLSLSFLIVSIIAQIFYNDEFSWLSFANTDGLTILALFLALISLVALKIPVLRKIIIWIMLKLNFLQIDYRMSTTIEAPEDITLDQLFEQFELSVIEYRLDSNSYNQNFRSNNTLRIFHRALASNIEIKRIENDDYDSESELSKWLLIIDGVSPFRIVERNITFMLNKYLDILSRKNIHSSKVSLTISKKNTEYKLVDMGILLSARNYEINNSYTEINASNSTVITIDNNVGITMTSRNKGDFANSIVALKNILIS